MNHDPPPPGIVKGEVYAVYGDGDGDDEEFNNHSFKDNSSATEPEPDYIIGDLFDQNEGLRSPLSSSESSPTSKLHAGHDHSNIQIEPIEEFISGDLFSDDEQQQQGTTPINSNEKETGNSQNKKWKNIDKWIKHKCPYCDQLLFLNKLKIHCTRYHLGQDKKFKCTKCNVKMNNFRNLLIHIEKHEAGGQQCLICKKIFSSHQLLQEHLNSHRKITFQQCTEDGCGFLSTSNRDLTQHHKEFHVNDTTTTNTNSTITIDHPASKNEQFKCDLCILTYKRKIELDFHILEYHQFACPYQSCPSSKKMFSTRLELVNHITGHESTNQCKYCISFEQFPNPVELVKHICLRHTGEKLPPSISDSDTSAGPQKPIICFRPPKPKPKTIICSLCHKEILSRFINIKYHKEICPMKKDSKIICGINSCTKEFLKKSSGNYFRHKRNVHGVGTFRCCHESCDGTLVFRTIEERINHWNSSHYGISPFICKVCKTSFTLMDKYTDHVKKSKCQFNQDQEKCDTTTAAPTSSNFSIYLSKTFKCNTCPDETFINSSSYLKHLEIIHGIGKFPCGHQSCSYKGNFKTIIQREAHWNESHKGQSPFKCDKCYESFKIQENLDSHLKTDCFLNNHLSSTTTTKAEADDETNKGPKITRAIPQLQLGLGQNIKTEEIEMITID